jgi:hypothetical protein
VGVLKGASCVDCACTVRAAAVKTTFASGVGVPDGRLHAERISTKLLTRDRIRKTLDILSPRFGTIFYTNTDGLILPFVPTAITNEHLLSTFELILSSKPFPRWIIL